jgi:chitinase
LVEPSGATQSAQVTVQIRRLSERENFESNSMDFESKIAEQRTSNCVIGAGGRKGKQTSSGHGNDFILT